MKRYKIVYVRKVTIFVHYKGFAGYHTIKSVIKEKASTYIIYILRITIILFSMKQNIQKTSSGHPGVHPIAQPSDMAMNVQ